MPRLRGVDVSVAVQPGPRELPEFPHPDASSVRIVPISPCAAVPDASAAAAAAGPASPSALSPSPSPSSGHRCGSGVPRIHKTSPTVSVYVPSIPGARFCIRYAVTRPPEPPCHVFFRVLMNGRYTASWGINPAVRADGTVSRALYEPSDEWSYREAGAVLRMHGAESRRFYFGSASAMSVADDGGLIEVHVFRARGRRPRAPHLSTFRGQGHYGIVSPSAGLVERPEEMVYYDWALIDPKDSPFASFRFHYRSWKNLALLNLGSGQPDDALPSPLEPCRALRGSRRSSHEDGPRARGPQDNSVGVPGEPAASVNETAARRSTDSSAPSIATSLLEYVEGDAVGIEDIEYGLATQVPVRVPAYWNPLAGVWGKRRLPQTPRRSSSSSSSSVYECRPTAPPGSCGRGYGSSGDAERAEESREPRPRPEAKPSDVGGLGMGEGEWMKGVSPLGSAGVADGLDIPARQP